MANIIEDGVEAGTWNKYQSKNPIQRWLVGRFLETLTELASPLAGDCHDAIDVGCGEGMTTAVLHRAGIQKLRGLDFSAGILSEARACHPALSFEQANIYELEPSVHGADFVSACEVLEHLEHPDKGLERLAACCRRYCLLSVPREPLFRSMNFAAGKYLRRLGNSPGHLNHWSSRSFIQFVESRFDIIKLRQPPPWTVLLAKPKTR